MLFGLPIKEGTHLNNHIDKLNSILTELLDIDIKVNDEDT